MKTLLKTASAVALLAASASLAAAQDDALKIGMTFQEMNNPCFVSMQEALNEAAAQIGAEVIVTDAGHDVAKQISDVEDMLQQGIDILLLNPTDSAGVESAVRMAKDQGVIVVAVDANASGPVDTFVGSKNRDAGYQSCKYLAEALGGPRVRSRSWTASRSCRSWNASKAARPRWKNMTASPWSIPRTAGRTARWRLAWLKT